jgi:hypothetical protein
MQKLKEWSNTFNEYQMFIHSSMDNIKMLIEISNEADTFVSNDDILFTKSIISNTIHYLTGSLKIYQDKFLFDLQTFGDKINIKQKIINLTEDCFNIILNQYNFILNKMNFQSINDLNNEFDKLLNFHLKLIMMLNSIADTSVKQFQNKISI